MENWKEIKGYEGYYEISNKGNVRSITRSVGARGNSLRILEGKELTPTKNPEGYLFVNLWKDSKKEIGLIHRLVATAFKDNPDNLPEVHHIDFDKENNCADNLRWISKKENRQLGGGEDKKRGPKFRKIRCVNNGMVFNSIKEILDYTGLKNITPIYKVCKGEAKSSCVIDGKPGKWEYVE